MRIKSLYLIILFQITALCSWAQSSNDIFERENSNTEQEETIMSVDTDIPQGKASEESEKETKDSIRKIQIDEKWKKYLLEKNKEIKRFYYDTIQKIDSAQITKEKIESYKFTVNKWQKYFEEKKKTNTDWRDNDELDDMKEEFDEHCDKALFDLNRWEKKIDGWENKTEDDADKLPKWMIWAICLGAIMVLVPIFTQIKSGIMMRKVRKQQEQQAKQQQEEAERQMLLADDNNVVTLKN